MKRILSFIKKFLIVNLIVVSVFSSMLFDVYTGLVKTYLNGRNIVDKYYLMKNDGNIVDNFDPLGIAKKLKIEKAEAANAGQMTWYLHKEPSDYNAKYNSLNSSLPETSASTASGVTSTVTNANPPTALCESSNNTGETFTRVGAASTAAAARCLASFISSPMGAAINIATTDATFAPIIYIVDGATTGTSTTYVYLYKLCAAAGGDCAGAGSLVRFKTFSSTTDPGTTVTQAAITAAVPDVNVSFTAADRIAMIVSRKGSSTSAQNMVFDYNTAYLSRLVMKYTTLTPNKPSLVGAKEDDFTTGKATTACATGGTAYNTKWTCLQGAAASTAGDMNAGDTAGTTGDTTDWIWLRNKNTATGAVPSNFGTTPSNTFLYQSLNSGYGDGVVRTVTRSSLAIAGTPATPYSHSGLVLWVSNTDYIEVQVHSTASKAATGTAFVALNNCTSGCTGNNGTLTTVSLNPSLTSGLYNRVWLGFQKTGTSYQAQYSTDGTTWINLGTAVTHATAFTRVGLNAFARIASPINMYSGAFEWFQHTFAPPLPPTVTTTIPVATSVTETTATLNGNITGGGNATVRGFDYGTDNTLVTHITTTESGTFSTGAFTANISSLTCGLTYYARAYATNTGGTGQGSIQSFNSVCTSVALNTPDNLSSTSDTTPTLNFTGTSPDSSAIEYEVQVDTADTFDGQTQAIAIGGAATDRASAWNANNITALLPNGAATSSGILTAISIRAWTNLTNVKVGTFYGSGTSWTNRDYDIIGSVVAGSLQTFIVNIAVEPGDIIGLYALGLGNLEMDTSAHLLYFNGDTITLGGAQTYYETGTGTGTASFGTISALNPLISASSDTDAGFTDVQVGHEAETHPFHSGDLIEYTVQSALTNGVTYYWRVRGKDLGSGIYGGWSSTRSFDILAGVTVAGFIYTDDTASTPFDCSATNLTVKVAVNGVLAPGSGSCTLNTGVFSVPSVPITGAGQIITAFIDTATPANQGVTITRLLNADAISGLSVISGRVMVRDEDGTSITNANLGTFDADNVGGGNIPFTSNSNNLSLTAGHKLLVWAGKTFTPGGNVTTAASSMAGNIDGDVLIQSGATLAMGANALSVGGDYLNSGTLTKSSGQLTAFTATGTGFTITPGTGNFGNVTFNGSGGAWATADAMTVNNDLTINQGTLTVGANNITVTGATSIAGGLTLSSATGTKTFTGDVTINAGGIWNNSGNAAVGLAGNLTNNQTFTAGSGVYTMSGTSKTISGIISIPSLTISGTTQNNGTLTVATALSGASTLTNSSGATLNIGGTSGITGLVPATSANTINYTGTAQTIHAPTTNPYWHLGFSGTGANTISLPASVTAIAGGLTLLGTAAVTTGASVTVSGTTTVGTGTSLTNANTFTLTSPTIISTGSMTNNGTVTASTALGGTGTFTNGATGILNIGFASAPTITTLTATASGNIVNYTAAAPNCKVTAYDTLNFTGSGAVTCAVTTVTKDVNLSGTVSWTTTAGLAISGILNIGTGTSFVNGAVTSSAPTVTITSTGAMTNNGTFTVNTALSGTGTLTQGSGATLNIGGTSGITGLTATVNSNTVNYTGASQAIKAITYHNLTVNGSGTATIGGVTIVNATMTVSSAVTNNSTLTVTGALSGASTLTQGSGATLNIGGTSGITGLTATVNSNTVNYTGASQAIKAITYHNLTVNGSGTATIGGVTIVNATMTATSAVTNNSTLTVTGALNGASTLTNGATGTLNIGFASAPAITTLTATAPGNTVYYTAAAPNCKITTYHNLYFTGSGAVTCAVTTVNGNLADYASAPMTWTTGGALNIGGNFSISNFMTLTQGAFSITVADNMAIGTAGAGKFIGSGSALNLNGNLTLSSNSTWTKGTGAVTFNKGAAQIITDNTTSKQDLGAVATATASTAVSTNTNIKLTSLNIAGSTTWNITGDTMTITGNNTPLTVTGAFTTTGSTVIYNHATSATVTPTIFNNLTLGGIGTYTMPATDTTLRGNLVITSGANVTKGNGIIIFAIGNELSQTLIDSSGNNSDIGKIKISANNGNSILNLGSSIKATSISIDGSQIFVIGANALTLTGSIPFDLSIFGTASIGSTIVYAPSQASGTVNLPGDLSYYNVQFNKASNSFEPATGTITVNNNLDVIAGTLELNTNDTALTVTGVTTITGTLSASSDTDSPLTITGDLINNGVFTHNNGKVVVTPTSTTTIGGSAITNFYDFTSTVADKTIQFKNGQDVGFAGTMTVTGDQSDPINLYSDSPGNQWKIVSTGPVKLTFVRVLDGGCGIGTNSIYPHETVSNFGNNSSCWKFVGRGSGGSSSLGGSGSGGATSGSSGGSGGSGGSEQGSGSGGAVGGAVGGGGGEPSP